MILNSTMLDWQKYVLYAAALLVIAFATFGAGYYKGSQNTLKPLAQATVHAATQAAQAQSEKTAADAKANHVDAVARADANEKREIAVQAIKRSAPALLPPPLVCPPISSAAMGKLNDPDIIGSDAQ